MCQEMKLPERSKCVKHNITFPMEMKCPFCSGAKDPVGDGV